MPLPHRAPILLDAFDSFRAYMQFRQAEVEEWLYRGKLSSVLQEESYKPELAENADNILCTLPDYEYPVDARCKDFDCMWQSRLLW